VAFALLYIVVAAERKTKFFTQCSLKITLQSIMLRHKLFSLTLIPAVNKTDSKTGKYVPSASKDTKQ
jgi:hypothetical protein